MRKIVVAVTGASGAVYAEQLIKKLLKASNQWDELAMVFSNNAKDVWQTELGNRSYDSFDIPVFDKQDFNAPFASGSEQWEELQAASRMT
jgi:4-hydroxy-3-polyprenylbenzoate decarboxylase